MVKGGLMKNPKVADSIEYADICNGCGLCCILRFDKPTFFGFAEVKDHEDCQYLQRLPNGLTLCSIHPNHTGTVIKRVGNAAFICAEIMDITTLFEDCPYNERKVLK
jgi:uncharacterized cysteine cluster protein YcgN (CxxCxxCC family)